LVASRFDIAAVVRKLFGLKSRIFPHRWRWGANAHQAGRAQRREARVHPRSLLSATDDKIFPEGGGMLIRAADGEVVGAVGVTGDTEARDEELAADGIRSVGFKTDEDCAELGRHVNVRQTK
jgi:Haem-degrading